MSVAAEALAELTSLIHAPIVRAFDVAMPDWWPDTEEWAREAAAVILAAGYQRD